ncbi:hypothetical protein [Jannaschia aquimarina]|uniref:Uncharacterized protein n=1 Tax=Jannaschia aquimarina TaxID=935700 RepID=A0A0D1CJA5_9RHOB|nr:hypothetical protein [Jannaschia aquimarina]KIT14787.1 hypothetical protein jaqu_35030 [Jannaschia aquimarina]SNT43817.1 hypothetical protein SAMN05421775_1243 [Jannaschia aquimarina]
MKKPPLHPALDHPFCHHGVGYDVNALDGMISDLDARLTLAEGEAGGAALRDVVLEWDGGTGQGPLLVITHFPNVEAMTRFRIYEGAMMIVDPNRDGRVLGYLRLGSAEPDPIRYPDHVVRVEAKADTDD